MQQSVPPLSSTPRDGGLDDDDARDLYALVYPTEPDLKLASSM